MRRSFPNPTFPIGAVALTIAMVCGYVTHLIVCGQASAVAFLLLGAIVWPIGVVHGALCWFGLGAY